MGQSPLALFLLPRQQGMEQVGTCSPGSRGWSSGSCSSPGAWVLLVNPFLLNTT